MNCLSIVIAFAQSFYVKWKKIELRTFCNQSYRTQDIKIPDLGNLRLYDTGSNKESARSLSNLYILIIFSKWAALSKYL